MAGFTVIDVIRQLGFEPERKLSWACGDATRNRYIEDYGYPPQKLLRKKTNGLGTHCFAVYPHAFLPVAKDVVSRLCEEFQAIASQQLSFPDME